MPHDDWQAELDHEVEMRRAEGAFIEHERAAIVERAAQAPTEPDAFVAWFEALKEEAIQRAEFEEFSKAQSSHITEWAASVLKFENDNTAPNPFEMPKSGTFSSRILSAITSSSII